MDSGCFAPVCLFHFDRPGFETAHKILTQPKVQSNERKQWYMYTMLCPIKVNRNTIELTLNTSCYCV